MLIRSLTTSLSKAAEGAASPRAKYHFNPGWLVKVADDKGAEGPGFADASRHRDHPTPRLVDDEYLFGSGFLVAPLIEKTTSRAVYLPGGGKWIDYQTRRLYAAGWQKIEAGPFRNRRRISTGANSNP